MSIVYHISEEYAILRPMKALIPAAGHGTRFLPVTRVVPKEMLPVGSKPAIQLIVEEALAAGADEVVIVTSPEKEIIKRYFDGDPDLAARIRTHWLSVGPGDGDPYQLYLDESRPELYERQDLRRPRP